MKFKFIICILLFQVIKAGESIDLVQLSVKKEAWDGDRHMDSYLTLDTNLTSVRVPLIAFDGKLKPVSLKRKISKTKPFSPSFFLHHHPNLYWILEPLG